MKKLTLAVSAAALALTGGAAIAVAKGAREVPDMTRAQSAAKAGEMWTRLDVNKDGVLNQADRDAKKLEMFGRIDANKDGSISRDEFMAAHPGGPRGEHAGMGGPGGEPGAMAHGGRGGHHGMRGHGMGGHGMGGHGMGMMMMHTADANKDGTITRAEYDAAVAQHFDKVDANHDGTITGAERKAAREAMRKEMEQMRAATGAPMEGMDMPPPPPGE